MAVSQTQRWCPTCGKPTLHLRHHSGFAVGCLLTIVAQPACRSSSWARSRSSFAWPIWFLASLVQALSIPYRCQQCGEGQMTFLCSKPCSSSRSPLSPWSPSLSVGEPSAHVRDRPVANRAAIETNSLDEPPPNPPVAHADPAGEAAPFAEATAIETNSPKEPPKPVQSELPATKPAQPVPEGQPTVGSIARFKDSPEDAPLLRGPDLLVGVRSGHEAIEPSRSKCKLDGLGAMLLEPSVG